MGVTERAVGVVGVAALALASACQPARAPGASAQPTISLRVRGGPPAATVIVDEEAIGTLDVVMAHGIALPVGVHHVTVTAAGYFPWDRVVDAPAGSAPITLEVSLARVPD